MALNQNRALNDLERTKFKDGATETNSVVQVYETNQVNRDDLNSNLVLILKELKKITQFIELNTNTKLEG